MGLQIFSLEIVWEGEEVPILDGSARPFVEQLRRARKSLVRENKVLRITTPLEIKENNAWVKAEPADNWEINYEIDFNHPLIGRQKLMLEINEETFIKEIAPARTFGFLWDVESLRKKGMAYGSSLENTVVLDEKEIVNPPLRFPDEFVRHKILDFIGDLALLGGRLKGRFSAYRAGHQLHQQLVRFVRENKNYWIFEENFA
jgi:UDP-3-O-[3-hydroxymyristoyl] N-acetylglucosamine deacetylase